MINQDHVIGNSRVRFQNKASVQTLPMRNTFHDSVSLTLSKLNQLNCRSHPCYFYEPVCREL